MNDLPEVGLSAQEFAAVQDKLLRLLEGQIERYTMGESSSVRTETAEGLLRSLCFCIGISPDVPDDRWRALISIDLYEEYQKGIGCIENKIRYGKRVWQALCEQLPPVRSVSMTDTLKSIGTFWRRYDYRFFAHEIPCDIDYQLSCAVPEELLGVNYVNQYLERLWIENRFLRKFSPDALNALLERACPDYRGLLVNLFEPVFIAAVGLSLLGRPADGLFIDRDGLCRLASIFENMMERDIEKSLCSAAGIYTDSGAGAATEKYLRACCRNLAVRIDRLRDCGGLAGIFSVG